jgi:ADP-ribose pyrophosphatase YjhB (NUDIX family)
MSYHPIQKHILLTLAKNPKLKYSELKIKDVENDLFNYHLQYLVKQGLVKKEEERYVITDIGVGAILLVDSTGKEYKGLRASVLVYVIERKSNPIKILKQDKKRKPYFMEKLPGIAGKIKPGEKVEVAARRKLLEETGLDGECKFIGTIRKTRINKEGHMDDAFFYVCVCEKWKNQLLFNTEYGDNSWCTKDEAIILQKDNIASGELSFKVLLRLINADYSLFFFEEETKVDSF